MDPADHAPQPLHVIKDYTATPDRPICLHENRFFRMMFNGRFHYLDGVKYGRGAIVVPQLSNGNFLLVRQQRAPQIGMSLEFPRGGVAAGETVEQGALRELREETGFASEHAKVRFLGRVAGDTATLNGATEVYHVVLSVDFPVGDFDRHEIDQVLCLSPLALEAMLASGGIVCGLTQAAWALLKVRHWDMPEGEPAAEHAQASRDDLCRGIVRCLHKGDSVGAAILAAELARRQERATLPLAEVFALAPDYWMQLGLRLADAGLPM